MKSFDDLNKKNDVYNLKLPESSGEIYDNLANSQPDSVHTGEGENIERPELTWQQRYMRLAADFERYKQRSMRERAKLEETVSVEQIARFFDLYDDFSRLIGKTEFVNEQLSGLIAIQQKWLNWFAENDVEILNSVGEEFDPAYHEAVYEQPCAHPDKHARVAEVISNGYLHKGKVIRPAKVVVGRFTGPTEVPINIIE